MTQSTMSPPAASRLNWKVAIGAGLIAGVVFMMMEMGLVAARGQSPWGPPRMIAAIAMGPDVLPPPASFDAAVLTVAMAIHMALSVLLALVFAFVAGHLGLVTAVVAGAVFGLLIYFVNFYGLTTFYPWFAMARNGISIVSHVAFGAVLALSYKLIAR